jgi:hypothetical protein
MGHRQVVELLYQAGSRRHPMLETFSQQVLDEADELCLVVEGSDDLTATLAMQRIPAYRRTTKRRKSSLSDSTVAMSGVCLGDPPKARSTAQLTAARPPGTDKEPATSVTRTTPLRRRRRTTAVVSAPGRPHTRPLFARRPGIVARRRVQLPQLARRLASALSRRRSLRRRTGQRVPDCHPRCTRSSERSQAAFTQPPGPEPRSGRRRYLR